MFKLICDFNHSDCLNSNVTYMAFCDQSAHHLADSINYFFQVKMVSLCVMAVCNL